MGEERELEPELFIYPGHRPLYKEEKIKYVREVQSWKQTKQINNKKGAGGGGGSKDRG